MTILLIIAAVIAITYLISMIVGALLYMADCLEAERNGEL